MAETAVAGCRLDLRWHDSYWGGKPSGLACGESSFALATFAWISETAYLCGGELEETADA